MPRWAPAVPEARLLPAGFRSVPRGPLALDPIAMPGPARQFATTLDYLGNRKNAFPMWDREQMFIAPDGR
jgi:hypothetical protein